MVLTADLPLVILLAGCSFYGPTNSIKTLKDEKLEVHLKNEFTSFSVYTSVFQPFQWSGTLYSNFDGSQNPFLGGTPEARRLKFEAKGGALEHCKLPQRGSGQSPNHNYILDLLTA